MTEAEKMDVLKLIGDMGVKIPEQCVNCLKKESCILAGCIEESPCNRRETMYWESIAELRY